MLTCLATCKKEENPRDQYAVAVCKVGETVLLGHLNCVLNENLITIEKIHGKVSRLPINLRKTWKFSTAKLLHYTRYYQLNSSYPPTKRYIIQHMLSCVSVDMTHYIILDHMIHTYLMRLEGVQYSRPSIFINWEWSRSVSTVSRTHRHHGCH